MLTSQLAVDSRDSSQSRDGSVEMADSVATVEMDLDEDEVTSDHAVAENAAAIGGFLVVSTMLQTFEAVSIRPLPSEYIFCGLPPLPLRTY